MSSSQKTLDLLEEDDEFEEFEQEDWDIRREDQTDIKVWEDNWDNDDLESDFCNQLRKVLEAADEQQEK
uniref:26S proteasome complex subunit SEM1 n=1 Tax=Pseudodiaptomus poplesia TaxID=213370 RepID=A0A0U2T7H1_9MAXI|nr:putative 26S proteasome complex subunit DSS1 [Pseudodiaptomus poplesia]